MPKFPKNPLDLPELRAHISRFVTPNDAIACVQVCKDWTHDFSAAVWHTINFKTHKGLESLGWKVLRKYGHHIRVVKNLEVSSHLDIVLWSKASKILSLQIFMDPSLRFQTDCSEILSRNNASLTVVRIIQHPDCLTTQLRFSLDSLIPTACSKDSSKLTELQIAGLHLASDTVSTLLKACPFLESFSMRDTVISPATIKDTFQHQRVKCLVAPIKQVFTVGYDTTVCPSLLAHFPNLETWHTWTQPPTPSLGVSPHIIKTEVIKFCPNLKALYAQAPSAVTVQLVCSGFEGLKEVCVSHVAMTSSVIMAILTHQETLEFVRTYEPYDGFYEQDNVKEVEDYVGYSWRVQMLLLLCRRLRAVELPMHEMDMDEIERSMWTCENLQILRVRVQGLDTKEKIDRAIQMWLDGSRLRRELVNASALGRGETEVEAAVDLTDFSIEARVARRLLKFDRLSTVWLGTKTYNV
ncbi:hypothetical protein BGZ58_007237 [Dissophora ornata]|nr:hypothetical protein BGZ58_007237 [Dissophora ornata]